MKRLQLLLLLFIIPAYAFSQSGSADTSKPKGQRTSRENPEANSEEDNLRRQQIRALRADLLVRALDNIKKMDEPTSRLSARAEMCTYIGGKGFPVEDQDLASELATDAFADFANHSSEIPSVISDYYLGELEAWLEKTRPDLVEKIKVAQKAQLRSGATSRIRALLQMKGGDITAGEVIREQLSRGEDVQGLYFLLDELMKQQSSALTPVLSDIITFAGRGSVSLEALFWVAEIYRRTTVAEDLRRRFVNMVVARTNPANFVNEPTPKVAYDLLTSILHMAAVLTPDSYEQIQVQALALRASLTQSQLASDARAKRLKESQDPIADLVEEAEASKSKIERNHLLAQAAQMALAAKKLQLCLEIVSKLDLSVRISLADFWHHWTDQFLRSVVKAALDNSDIQMALKAGDRVISPSQKVAAMILIMRYAGKNHDRDLAQKLLMAAEKIATDTPDNFERARAFALLSGNADVADSNRAIQLLEFEIRALNNLAKPDQDDNDKKVEYLRNLDKAASDLRRNFRLVTVKDNDSVLPLIGEIQKSDLRTFALIGTLQGLDEMLSANAVK